MSLVRSTCFSASCIHFSLGSHNISEVPSLKLLGEATPIKGTTATLHGRNGSRLQIPDSSFWYVLLLDFSFNSTGWKLILKALFCLLLLLLLSPVVRHCSHFRSLLPRARLSSPRSLALPILTTMLGNPTVLLPL